MSDRIEKTAREALKLAADALKPFADCVFNDNGDMTVSTSVPTHDQLVNAYYAELTIRRALEGAGERDRLPTFDEAVAALELLSRCNGADLSEWTGDILPSDDLYEAWNEIREHKDSRDNKIKTLERKLSELEAELHAADAAEDAEASIVALEKRILATSITLREEKEK